jgi:hypothetical protein
MRNVKTCGRHSFVSSPWHPDSFSDPLGLPFTGTGALSQGLGDPRVMITHRYLAPWLSMSGAIPLFLRAYIRVAKLSQKSRSHLKILGARSKFRTEDQQILGADVLNLVAMATGRPGFLRPWLTWCTQGQFHLFVFFRTWTRQDA